MVTADTRVTQLPGIQQTLVSGKDWKLIAAQQRKTQFGACSRVASEHMLSEMLNNLDFLCELQQPHDEPSTASDSNDMKVKASFWRKVTGKVCHGVCHKLGGDHHCSLVLGVAPCPATSTVACTHACGMLA
jgi:hypothetical protein